MQKSPEIVHHVTGRLRLRVADGRGRAQVLHRLRDSIASIDGVERVEVNSNAGSIVIFYDRRRRQFVSELTAAGVLDFPTPQNDRPRGPVWVRKFAGRGLFALGVAGILLPVIPGTPFLLASLAFLGVEDPVVRRGIRLAGRIASQVRSST